jgi:hypothetical protein
MHPGFAFWLWMMMSPRLAQRMLLGLPIGDALEAFDPFSTTTKALSS